MSGSHVMCVSQIGDYSAMAVMSVGTREVSV